MNERFIQEVLSYLPKKIPQTMRDFFYMALSKGLVGKKVYFDAEAKKDVSNEEEEYKDSWSQPWCLHQAQQDELSYDCTTGPRFWLP